MHFLLCGYGSMGRRHAANLQCLVLESRITLYDPIMFPMQALIPADAVIIASPLAYHAAQIEWCCRCRPPLPFLVEKPLAIDTLPAVYDPRCAVGFNYRFHRQWEAIAQLARRGRLIFTAYEQLLARYGPTVAGTSTSHAIDMALALLGPAESVHLASDGVCLFGYIEHAHGRSQYRYHMDAPVKHVIIGNGDESMALERDEDCYVREMQAWLACLYGGARNPRLATLADGLAVEQVLCEVSYATI